MAREVVWTEPAWEDVAAAADYIARDSESYAATFIQEVKEAAASLTHFAERGQVVPGVWRRDHPRVAGEALSTRLQGLGGQGSRLSIGSWRTTYLANLGVVSGPDNKRMQQAPERRWCAAR